MQTRKKPELRLALGYLTSPVSLQHASPAEPRKRQCKVLFEYQPVNDDELALKPGDVLDITEEVTLSKLTDLT